MRLGCQGYSSIWKMMCILNTWKIMAIARPATATETVPLVATVTNPVRVMVRRAKLSIRHMNQR